jgi:hypothetical protein
MTDTNDYEANESRIADYIDSKMSPAAEEVFMQELGRDDGLRQQYENELLMRALLREHRREGEDGGEAFLQPADEHLRMIGDALRKRGGNYFRWLAAAVMLALCGLLVWLFERRNHAMVIVTPELVRNSGKAAEVNTDSVFAHYYCVYTRAEHDPVQVSLYYQYYRQGKYDNVLAAGDEDVRQLGADQGTAAGLYLELYQGLSLLASRDAAGALTRFGEVLQKASVGSPVNDAAAWYSVLAYLKNKEVAKASDLAQHMVRQHSSYEQQATALLQTLTSGGSR